MSTTPTATTNRPRVNNWLGTLRQLEAELSEAGADAFSAAKENVKSSYDEATAKVIRLTGQIEAHMDELAKALRTPRKPPAKKAAANGSPKAEKPAKTPRITSA